MGNRYGSQFAEPSPGRGPFRSTRPRVTAWKSRRQRGCPWLRNALLQYCSNVLRIISAKMSQVPEPSALDTAQKGQLVFSKETPILRETHFPGCCNVAGWLVRGAPGFQRVARVPPRAGASRTHVACEQMTSWRLDFGQGGISPSGPRLPAVAARITAVLRCQRDRTINPHTLAAPTGRGLRNSPMHWCAANEPVFMVAHSVVVMPTGWYSSLGKKKVTK